MRTEKEIRDRINTLESHKVFSSFGIMRATKSIITTLQWVLEEKELPKTRGKGG